MADQRIDTVLDAPQARLNAGGQMRAAREAAGLSLPQMAQETKIPVRMLTLVEAGDFAALPAKAYATGFTRTYARALGLDAQELVAEVRRELGQVEAADARTTSTFEPGDPARVPTARFAWLAAVAALVVLGAGLLLWRSYYAPSVTLPPLSEPSAPAPLHASVPLPAVAPAGGPEAAASAPALLPAAPAIPSTPRQPRSLAPPAPSAAPAAASSPEGAQPSPQAVGTSTAQF